MAAPIPLRRDVTAADLRQQARHTRDASQARRLLALAEIYDGGSRTDAARIGGVTLQIVRDWVLRFTQKGKGAGLVLPYCDTEAMAAQLQEISQAVAPGAHAVLLLDQAGWHVSPKLRVPDNITLVLLPPRSPELNPVENVWQFLRSNWLSNRVFETYEAIIEAACEAWRKLLAQPHTITSIGTRDWAHVGQK